MTFQIDTRRDGAIHVSSEGALGRETARVLYRPAALSPAP
jgi:hypothetical protein